MEPVIAEEFSVWKKNTPLLYDLVISHSLEWPSLTVEWLPSLPSTYAGDLSVHKLILGTHTSDDAPNFLMLADVHLPADPSSALVVDPEKSVLPKDSDGGRFRSSYCSSMDVVFVYFTFPYM